MSEYNTKIYTKQGGAEQVIASGGKQTVESGGEVNFAAGAALKLAGTDYAAVLANAIAGVAPGAKVTGGEATLDGSNPTSVTTGLSTIVAAIAVIKKATTPGDDPIIVTVDYGGAVPAGRLDLYAWKTDGSDPTLVASTNNSAVVSWIAIGT